MGPTSKELASLLRAHGLVPPGAEGILNRHFPQADDLFAALVKGGWLTDWQVKEISKGKGKGLILGRYVFLEKLGEGGMGQVYLARHTTLERQDAVKIIHPDRLNQESLVRRFLREARACALLQHPNLVSIFDAGQVEGRYFLAMEYIPGMDLSRLVRQHGPLPWTRVCAMLQEVAQGLQHAHERGLVHRDLKPSNLLLSNQTGQIKILDLGLAYLLAEGEEVSSLTATGAILGTPDYMAPEQANGSRVDIRADLYSLGCTAYHLLVGHVPFPGGSALEKLLRHRVEQPRGLALAGPPVPGPLLAIIERLMAKDPQARFQSPAELAQALQPLLARKPSSVPPSASSFPLSSTETFPSGLPSPSKPPPLPVAPPITVHGVHGSAGGKNLNRSKSLEAALSFGAWWGGDGSAGEWVAALDFA